ncbi:hypothetical protein F7230_05715 [Corynebacterium sp. 320]|uniref:Lipoprotein LpqE n=1 Tax=Corynebacterium zhongnanshanii TaxID=2768834 RepID=A0ABQ6VCZ3_9CORY|nr:MULTISPECIES: hypothetical protein [Corynebacterium]KAB1503042.1 hypothetical protein F7230_05715 [Corynebacterium sp. 320]KAB1551106.1 hypothetical protein F7232_08650 [Corynebacterium sp. 319]KAB3519834.1 hypothetical protein F8377_07915 [Corynebacterium zhongnanshanii]KAB3526839.1 hypothetical protein F8354_05715 [Corynebacterium sp. 250]KAB3538332.1 hypothetical protein F8390_08615 [Corynebacterium sp. 366]
MKTLKSTAVRGALTFVAAGSALALTACGAGQISQTANQVAAVNGTSAEDGHTTVRDVSVVIAPDNTAAVKFTAGNIENNHQVHTLKSVKVDGKPVTLTGDKNIEAGCSLIASYQEEVNALKKGATKSCNTYVVTQLADASGVFVGGNSTVTFTFDHAELETPASVVAYTPAAGEFNRGENGLTENNGGTPADPQTPKGILKPNDEHSPAHSH